MLLKGIKNALYFLWTWSFSFDSCPFISNGLWVILNPDTFNFEIHLNGRYKQLLDPEFVEMRLSKYFVLIKNITKSHLIVDFFI